MDHAGKVAISITTRNRRADLERTLQILAALKPPADEILVVADGCEADMAELVRSRYPNIHLWINPIGQGSIPSRDRMLREAGSEIVLSLDDDSYPLEKDFLGQLKLLFADQPNLAVLTFPQITDEYPETLAQAPAKDAPRMWIGSFANSGAAFRRAVYLQLPGYVPAFQHSYEEPDYALQCIAAGFEVVLEPTLTIRHHYSGVARNEMRMHHLHSRNELWSAALRCPWWLLPLVAPYRVMREFMYAWKRGSSWVLREPQWWWSALKILPGALTRRCPVPVQRYWQWMQLVRKPRKLEERKA